MPGPKINPVILNKKIDKLHIDNENQRKLQNIRYTALKTYFGNLTNFTSHDIKNAVHNMDSVISTIDTDSVTPADIKAIKTCLAAIRKSLDDFNKLSPDDRKVEFSIQELTEVLEILNVSAFAKEKISYKFKYNPNEEKTVNQPLHSIVQTLNNLIINSIKAVENNADKQILMEFNIINDEVVINVCDNGMGILPENREKVFDIYFTTTGGSGIGLAHASFNLEQIKGTIKLNESNEKFNTIFEVKFPLKVS